MDFILQTGMQSPFNPKKKFPSNQETFQRIKSIKLP